jgi:hypothetical protein
MHICTRKKLAVFFSRRIEVTLRLCQFGHLKKICSSCICLNFSCEKLMKDFIVSLFCIVLHTQQLT